MARLSRAQQSPLDRRTIAFLPLLDSPSLPNNSMPPSSLDTQLQLKSAAALQHFSHYMSLPHTRFSPVAGTLPPLPLLGSTTKRPELETEHARRQGERERDECGAFSQRRDCPRLSPWAMETWASQPCPCPRPPAGEPCRPLNGHPTVLLACCPRHGSTPTPN